MRTRIKFATVFLRVLPHVPYRLLPPILPSRQASNKYDALIAKVGPQIKSKLAKRQADAQGGIHAPPPLSTAQKQSHA